MTDPDAPEPDAPDADPWGRRLYEPGGDDALVFLVAFGADLERFAVDTVRHRVDEIPEGFDLLVQGADAVAAFLEPPIGDVLREDQPDLVDEALRAESCLVLRADVADPPDLRYLRRAVGIMAAATDAGAVAVYNLQSFGFFSAASWRDDVFGPDRPDPAHFVVMLSGEDDDRAPDGHVWLHTRGLRLFGRPDLSLRAVPADDVDLASRLLSVLIDQQVRGLLVPDGASMDVPGPIGRITFHHRGHHDDPDFNNVHLEIDWADRH